MQDPYKLLGTHALASPAEVKTAWKKSVLEHHPDRGGNAKTFIAINKAYEEILALHQKTSEPYDYHTWTPKTNSTPQPAPEKQKTPYFFTLKISILGFLLPILSTILSTPGYLLTQTAPLVLSVNSLGDVLNMTLPFMLVTVILKNKLYKLYTKYPKILMLSYLALLTLQPLDPSILTNQPILPLINALILTFLLLGYYLFKSRAKTQ